MGNTNGMVRFGARVVIALLIVIPLWLFLTLNTGNPAWIAWAAVSIWAALDAVPLVVRAFPGHHKPILAVMITVLALVNVVISLGTVMMPGALFRN
jgi:hypothetical protein